MDAATGDSARVTQLFREQFGPELRRRIPLFKNIVEQKRNRLLHRPGGAARTDEFARSLIDPVRVELQWRAETARRMLQGTIRDIRADLKPTDVVNIFDSVVELPIAQDIESACHAYLGRSASSDWLDNAIAQEKRTAVDVERGKLNRWAHALPHRASESASNAMHFHGSVGVLQTGVASAANVAMGDPTPLRRHNIPWWKQSANVIAIIGILVAVLVVVIPSVLAKRSQQASVQPALTLSLSCNSFTTKPQPYGWIFSAYSIGLQHDIVMRLHVPHGRFSPIWKRIGGYYTCYAQNTSSIPLEGMGLSPKN